MQKHVTAVGVLNMGMGLFGILIAVVMFGLLAGVGFLVDNDPTGQAILIGLGTGMGLFMLVVSVPDIVGGIGLLMRKRWARILLMVLAVLKLFNIPIGTAVGAYSLWILLQDETEELFAQGAIGPVDEPGEL
jgi:hypothetical protein